MVLPLAIMGGVAAALSAASPPRHRRPTFMSAPAAIRASLLLAAACAALAAVLFSASKMGIIATFTSLFVMGSFTVGTAQSGLRRWSLVSGLAIIAAAAFFFLTPMIYLSGFIFPIENMPALIQPFTYLIPLRYFLVIVRGIFLKGIGLELLWPQAAALAAWGAVMLTLAVVRSRKQAA